MNVQGWIRGYMSKSMDHEKFLLSVVELMEKEMKEWDETFYGILMKLSDYRLVIKNNESSYEVTITENELATLQDRSPFSVDRYLWEQLEKQGLEIKSGYGNYIYYVFIDRFEKRGKNK